MKTIQSRLNHFLENYEFYPNSVDFRIVSSRALEKFKNVQAFQLNEIRNGKYKFGKSRRELLLLKFDLLTRVLTETENLCIQHYHDNVASQFIVDSASHMLTKSRKLYNKIITEDHKDSFDDVFSKIWLDMTSTVEYVINGNMQKLIGCTLEVFFTEFVNIVSRSIQNSTFELFELDVHMSKNGHVDPMENNLSIEPHATLNNLQTRSLENFRDDELNKIHDRRKSRDSECLMIVISNQTNTANEYTQHHLKNKIEIYLNNFDIKHIFFKNLSDSPIKFDVIKLVESYGIPLDLRRSLIA